MYDPEGRDVYSVKGGSITPAESYDPTKKGKYAVTARAGLHLRVGPSTMAGSLEVMPEAARVRCYGYYTKDWLCVVSPTGNIGYAYTDYLREV